MKILGLDCFAEDVRRLLSVDLQWSDRTVTEQGYTAMLCVFLTALLPLSYEFYGFVRGVAFIGLYLHLRELPLMTIKDRLWFGFLMTLMVTYNPFFPIHFGEQGLWVLTSLVTLYCLFQLRRYLTSLPEQKTPKSDKVFLGVITAIVILVGIALQEPQQGHTYDDDPYYHAD